MDEPSIPTSSVNHDGFSSRAAKAQVSRSQDCFAAEGSQEEESSSGIRSHPCSRPAEQIDTSAPLSSSTMKSERVRYSAPQLWHRSSRHRTPPSAGSASSARRLEELKPEEQVLRLRASEISALAGLHPFKDVLELLDRHIYQDLPHLQAEDCASCGLVLMTKEEEFEELVGLAGPEAALLRQVHSNSFSAAVQTTQDVDRRRSDITDVLERVAARGRVGAEEVTLLRNHMTYSLATEYGKRHEDAGIKQYEATHGVQVHSQNDTLLAWTFPRDPTAVSWDKPPPLQVTPLRPEAMAHARGGPGESEGEMPGNGEAGGSDGAARVSPGQESPLGTDGCAPLGVPNGRLEALVSVPGVCQGRARSLRGPDAWFRVCGVMDGLTEALDASDDDPAAWRLRTTVVEVKHRVAPANVQDPPPFHDTLQLLTYMLMLDGARGGGGSTWGDLVQVARGQWGGRGGSQSCGSRTDDEEATVMATTRITLKGGQLEHGKLYFAHVVPRLYAYCDLVYALRNDADARRAFLLSDEDAKWDLVYRRLPFLPAFRPQFNYDAKKISNNSIPAKSDIKRRVQMTKGNGNSQWSAIQRREEKGAKVCCVHQTQQQQQRPQGQITLHHFYELRSQRGVVTRSADKRHKPSPMT